jgi:hypothetical protein
MQRFIALKSGGAIVVPLIPAGIIREIYARANIFLQI